MHKLKNTLRKVINYKIEDTNMALFGSDIEHQVKTEAAKTEVQWHGVGKKDGLDIWRIEKFKVVPVPKEKYGQFYLGDSYIILRTKQANNIFVYDIHFWLGEYTSQDEAGTAAYKTVELDDYLGGSPVQHREVAHHESELFISYFNPPALRRLEGGIASGFNITKPEEYVPRLLHIKSVGKNVTVDEVEMSRSSLNSGDIFILDLGLRLIQWNGTGASVHERGKAASLCRALDSERSGRPKIEVHNEGDDDLGEFWSHLGGAGKVKTAAEANTTSRGLLEEALIKRLFRVSDASGKMKFQQVAEGSVSASQLDSKDVFVFDAGSEIFVWVGKQANLKEKGAALQFSLDYLSEYKRPRYLPITKVNEGSPNDPMKAYLQ